MISSDSQLPDNNNEDQVTVLITALGNLIENALEALSQNPAAKSASRYTTAMAGCIAK